MLRHGLVHAKAVYNVIIFTEEEQEYKDMNNKKVIKIIYFVHIYKKLKY